jgi:hypothetical protein
MPERPSIEQEFLKGREKPTEERRPAKPAKKPAAAAPKINHKTRRAEAAERTPRAEPRARQQRSPTGGGGGGGSSNCSLHDMSMGRCY